MSAGAGRRFAQRPTLVLLFAVVLVGFAGTVQTSLLSTAVTVGIFSVMVVPLGFIYGQGGAISLAQGTFAAIGAYASAILTTRLDWSPAITLLISVAVPALLALAIARPILRLPELSLALATLALGVVIEVMLQRGGGFTGSFRGLTGIPTLPYVEGRLGSYLFIWLVVLLLVFCYANVVQTSRGRALNAIRVDRIHAEAVGVPVAGQLAGYFALAAGIAGFAGWFYAHYIGYIAPESLNMTLSANLLFMVAIGGRKTPVGPVLGALIFTVARDFLPGLESQGMYFGALLVLVLIFLPDGLLSVSPIRFARDRMRRRSATGDRPLAGPVGANGGTSR